MHRPVPGDRRVCGAVESNHGGCGVADVERVPWGRWWVLGLLVGRCLGALWVLGSLRVPVGFGFVTAGPSRVWGPFSAG
jgi:hypothetical protein